MSCADGERYRYPLSVAPTASHLVDQAGKPFLLVGDAAWSLIAAVSDADADFYLENRKQHGFTAVLANLLEKKFTPHAPANFYGFTAFTGKPFTTPREAYFAHADRVLQIAAKKGLAVFLFPLFLGYQCGSDDGGWCPEVHNASEADMRAWGEYVGNRYANYDNIVWVIGGDTDPSPVKSKLEAMIDGIRSRDTRHLFTVHNARHVMGVTPWSAAEWLTINTTYTEGIDYEQAQAAYRIIPQKPFFLIESQYENVRAPHTQAIRAQSYWTVLSGGFGHIFGNCPLLAFASTGGDCAPTDWRAQLESPGSLGMQHFGTLFHSRHWATLVPDTSQSVLIAGNGTFGNTDYALAACTADGTSIIAYLPSSRAITVSGACLAGSTMIAWWYDPSTGAATQIGTFPTDTPQHFTPPGGRDWVLVIDSSGASLSAPSSMTGT
jgi:hypothetical protein